MDLSPGDFARAYSPDGPCMISVLVLGVGVRDGVRRYAVTDGASEWETYILGRMPESKGTDRQGRGVKGRKSK